MTSVTMAHFRKDATAVLRAVRRGERVILTYRGKPIARLEPVRSAPTARQDDPLFSLASEAVDSPLGPLSHDEIDAKIYE